MPVKVRDLERVAQKLGFVKVRQKGSHARWKHGNGRATTIPVHPSTEIGGWLFHEILSQLSIFTITYEETVFSRHSHHGSCEGIFTNHPYPGIVPKLHLGPGVLNNSGNGVVVFSRDMM